MRGKHKQTHTGRWSITIEGGPDEAEYFEDLLEWAKNRDVHGMEEDTKIVQNIKGVTTGDKVKRQRAKKLKFAEPVEGVYEYWTKWYNILLKKYPDIAKPRVLPPEDGKHIKTLLKEYGEALTLEIFKVSVLDWDAFRLKNKRKSLPDIPTLRTVMYHRQELSAAVSRKGITTAKHRVSEYGKSEGAYDDWKIQ